MCISKIAYVFLKVIQNLKKLLMSNRPNLHLYGNNYFSNQTQTQYLLMKIFG